MRHLLAVKISMLALLSIMALPLTASASSVTYTLTAVGSGTLDGINFTNADVVFTQTADTANINYFPNCCYNYLSNTTTVTIAGVGLDTLNPSAGFLTQDNDPNFGLGTVGVYDLNSGSFYGEDNAAVLGYHLDGPFGPVAGDTNTNGFGDTIATEGGSLEFNAFTGSVFTATAGAVSATPEPSSFVLLGSGLAAAFGAARRRRNK